MKIHARTTGAGFTLVELLIVVAIIGIIAAIAIPNLMTAIQRGKQKRTMGDIRTIASGLESYNIDNSSYPGNAFSALSASTNIWSSFTPGTPAAPPFGGMAPDYYLGSPIWKDGWSTSAGSNPLYYGALVSGNSATEYILCSMSKNGTVDAVTAPAAAFPAGCVDIGAGPTVGGDGTTFNCDITIVNGQFIQQPFGKQSSSAGC